MEKQRKIMKNINRHNEKLKNRSILTFYVCVQYRSMTVVHPAIGCESVALSQGFVLAAQQRYTTTVREANVGDGPENGREARLFRLSQHLTMFCQVLVTCWLGHCLRLRSYPPR